MGSDIEFAPDTYRQAGHLARVFHDQAGYTDADWMLAVVAKSLEWLVKPHPD